MITMHKSHSFAKGMIAGILAGAAIGVIISPIDNRHRRAVKKNANKMVKMVQHML